ncbi:transposase [Nonomuraea sp. K274]|uniref:Transposase n=1 Tax=Nonomuraea cypriaca TaxID=1187855 RepID=A0A931ACF0_9ACTN|nr:transposase [Nonomuraea cypriaca]MBF8187983.1 transposase [Nonomuraea cypriaca]
MGDLAVDVSNWSRPDAATSPDRSFCHVYGRSRGAAQIVPGWKYSWIAAPEAGPAPWARSRSTGSCHPATFMGAPWRQPVSGTARHLTQDRD